MYFLGQESNRLWIDGHNMKNISLLYFTKLRLICSGLDLFAYDSESKTLHLVETRKLNVSWYVYTHESRLVLLASGMQCKTFTGFQV